MTMMVIITTLRINNNNNNDNDNNNKNNFFNQIGSLLTIMVTTYLHINVRQLE